MLRQRTWPTVLASPFLLAIPSFILALVPAVSPAPAHAFDDDGREAVIGAFDLPASPRSDNQRATDRTDHAPADDDVLNLYEDAMEDLAAGARASAQRLFERIVARAPESAVAARARRELAALYALDSNAPNGAKSDSTALRPASMADDTGHDWPVPSAVARSAEPRSAPTATVRPPVERLASPEVEMQFVLDAGDRVFFSAGTHDLGARARGVLAAQARWLISHPDIDVSIVGHADDAPLSVEQQAMLAQRRADSVRERLISEGVDVRRITVASVGRAEPVAECDRPECAAQNRRVVTELARRAPVPRPVGYSTGPR